METLCSTWDQTAIQPQTSDVGIVAKEEMKLPVDNENAVLVETLALGLVSRVNWSQLHKISLGQEISHKVALY